MLVFEDNREEDSQDKGEAGEDVPGGGPAGHQVGELGTAGGEVVDHRLRAERADRGAEAVGHHHEDALCAGADAFVGILVHEERAADVEKVEGNAVDDHRKDEQHQAETGGSACAQEGEAQEPGEERDEHHLLDAEALQAERNQQDAERLGHL